MPLEKDDKGRLHFEAAAPGQVAPQTTSGTIAVRPGTESGNSNFDPASGRFAGPNTDKSGSTGSTTPIDRAAADQVPGLAPIVNQYIALITQRFADAATMAVYPSDDSSTVVLFDNNGGRLTAFPVPNAKATQEQLDKFAQEVAKPAFDKAAAERVANMTRSAVPEGVDPEDWEAHMDVIRSAAREEEVTDVGSANQFLADRGASDVDAEQFLKDVREQRIDDLADILDHQLRGTLEQIKRARQTVRVTAPAGYTKRVFAGLDDNEVLKLLTKLEGRGWDPEDLKKHIVERISDPERKAKIEQLFGQKKPKSGKKTPKKANLADTQDALTETPEAVLMEVRDEHMPEPVNLAEEMTKLAGALPQPVHNIYVQMPKQEPQRMRRRPIRDEKNVITEVIEEPIND